MRWAVVTLLFLAACSSLLRPDRGVFERLSNRGRVPVSLDNQFMAANVLLARESERRPELKSILQQLGVPEEIEVIQDSAIQPYRLNFYYLKRHKSYELTDSGELWLLSEARSLALPKADESEATVQVFDRTARFTPRKELEPREIQPLETVATADPTLTRIRALAKNTPPNELTKTEYGHYLHIVAFPRLSLKEIALWHTLEFGNEDKIARINSLPIDGALRIGTRIKIPSYLMQNPKALTAESYGELLEIVH